MRRPHALTFVTLGFCAAAWTGCSGGNAPAPALPLDSSAGRRADSSAVDVAAKPTAKPTASPTPTAVPTNAPCSAPESSLPGSYISIAAAGTVASGTWTIAKDDGVIEGAADVIAYAMGTPLPSPSPKATPSPKGTPKPTPSPSPTPTASTSSVYAGEYTLTEHTSYPTHGCFAIAVPKGSTTAALAASPLFGTLDLTAKSEQTLAILSLSVKLSVGGTGKVVLADGATGTFTVQSAHTITSP